MEIELFITGDGLPVCEAHLEKYIDEPSFLASACEYDAWFQSHGKPMSCHRCRGADRDRIRNQVDAALLEENSPQGRRRTASGRALDDEIVRHFDLYISTASYSE